MVLHENHGIFLREKLCFDRSHHCSIYLNHFTRVLYLQNNDLNKRWYRESNQYFRTS